MTPEQQAAHDAAVTAAQTRLQAIITSADGAALPALAQHLAFKTDLPAEVCLGALAAAKADLSTTVGPASVGQPDPGAGWDGAVEQANGRFNVGLGVADPVGGDAGAEKVKKGWGSAVASANTRFQ